MCWYPSWFGVFYIFFFKVSAIRKDLSRLGPWHSRNNYSFLPMILIKLLKALFALWGKLTTVESNSRFRPGADNSIKRLIWIRTIMQGKEICLLHDTTAHSGAGPLAKDALKTLEYLSLASWSLILGDPSLILEFPLTAIRKKNLESSAVFNVLASILIWR